MESGEGQDVRHCGILALCEISLLVYLYLHAAISYRLCSQMLATSLLPVEVGRVTITNKGAFGAHLLCQRKYSTTRGTSLDP